LLHARSLREQRIDLSNGNAKDASCT